MARSIIVFCLWAYTLTAGIAAEFITPREGVVQTQAVYQTYGKVELSLHIFRPTGSPEGRLRGAILFFHGGGWSRGTARQFFQHSEYLASRGMVAISAEYRLLRSTAETIDDCLADAEAALVWVRSHARELGIDPNKIALGGGSAGGSLAAAAVTSKISAPAAGDNRLPAALVLFNPVLDLKGERAIRLGGRASQVSPIDHVRPGIPPTFIFHGTHDRAVPISQVETYCQLMRKSGNRCEVIPFSGVGHGFFNREPFRGETMREMDRSLRSVGLLH